MNSDAIEKVIEEDLSVDESYKQMTFLVEEAGERLAGKEGKSGTCTDFLKSETCPLIS